MTLTLRVTPELEQRLAEEAARQGIEVSDCALRVLDHHLPKRDRRARAVALIDCWLRDEDAQEQKETGDFLVRSLDEDRLSERKLFPPETEGVDW